jgi:hypothetical protein
VHEVPRRRVVLGVHAREDPVRLARERLRARQHPGTLGALGEAIDLHLAPARVRAVGEHVATPRDLVGAAPEATEVLAHSLVKACRVEGFARGVRASRLRLGVRGSEPLEALRLLDLVRGA